jgi:thymidine kinase
MFSNKSGALILEAERYRIAKLNVLILKPLSDARNKDCISSRSISNKGEPVTRHSLRAYTFDSLQDFLKLTKNDDFDVLIIDEAQFCEGEWIAGALWNLLQRRKHASLQILVGGLDMKADGLPFGSMPALMAMANRVIKLPAVCSACGADAHFSQRLVDSTSTVLIGDIDKYEPRCWECFEPTEQLI